MRVIAGESIGTPWGCGDTLIQKECISATFQYEEPLYNLVILCKPAIFFCVNFGDGSLFLATFNVILQSEELTSLLLMAEETSLITAYPNVTCNFLTRCMQKPKPVQWGIHDLRRGEEFKLVSKSDTGCATIDDS